MTPEMARAARNAKNKIVVNKKGIIPDDVVKHIHDKIKDTVDQVRNSIADSIAVKKSSPLEPSKSTQNAGGYPNGG